MSTSRFKAIRMTASAATSFTAKVATTTKPTGDGVIPASGFENTLPQQDDLLWFKPWGTNANNEDFHMRLWGWTVDTSATPQWEPSLILELVVTLGNIAASKGSDSFDADTITLAKGDSTAKIISPANDLPGYVVVDVVGFHLLEFDFDINAGATASTSASVLYRFLSQEERR
jgi:hypothetical protein